MKKHFSQYLIILTLVLSLIFLTLGGLQETSGNPKLQISLYSDKKIYHSNETMYLSLDVYSEESDASLKNSTIQISGIKNVFGIDVLSEDRPSVNLNKGKNVFKFEFKTPSCEECSTVPAGKHFINASVKIKDQIFTDSIEVILESNKTEQDNQKNKTSEEVIPLDSESLNKSTTTPSQLSAKTVHLEYFYDPACAHCAKASPVIDSIIEEYGSKLVSDKYNIKTDVGRQKAKEYGLRGIPTVVIEAVDFVEYEDYQDDLVKLKSILKSKIDAQLALKHDLIVNKDISSRTVKSGDLVKVKVTITNNGDEIAKNIQAEETINPRNNNFVLVNGTTSWIGSLRPRESISYYYIVKIKNTNNAEKEKHTFPQTKISYEINGERKEVLGEKIAYVVQPSLSIFTIMLVGLLAGFNPCLFAILAFIASITLATSAKRRNVLYMVVMFCLGILFTYMVVGLGLLQFLKYSTSLQDTIRIGLVALITILGIWQLYDAYHLKVKNRSTFATPKFFIRMTESLTQSDASLKLPASFFLGSLFSLIKAPCVGAVYFAILDMVFKSDLSEKTLGIFYLGVYNLGVILPILLIGLAITFGLNPEKVNKFRKDQRSMLRLLTGLSLILIAVLMQLRII
ncbi:MAG: cytochrome c biogenesis protein CcdA [Methanosarcinales archaeon]